MLSLMILPNHFETAPFLRLFKNCAVVELGKPEHVRGCGCVKFQMILHPTSTLQVYRTDYRV